MCGKQIDSDLEMQPHPMALKMVKFCPELHQAATIQGTMTALVEMIAISIIEGGEIEVVEEGTTVAGTRTEAEDEVADGAAFSNAVEEEEGNTEDVVEEEVEEKIEGEVGMTTILTDSMMETLA